MPPPTRGDVDGMGAGASEERGRECTREGGRKFELGCARERERGRAWECGRGSVWECERRARENAGGDVVGTGAGVRGERALGMRAGMGTGT
jgi:hypothetical protein